MNIVEKPGREWSRAGAILGLAINKFLQIDGAQWAGAFAFNAFLSLFPLLILLVTIASFFVDRNTAGTTVITFMKSYVPISDEMQSLIFGTLAGVISARTQAGAVAFLILVWSALQCFITLVIVTNRAWGTVVYSWWRLPLKSLMLLGATTGAILLGMTMPSLMRITEGWLFPVHNFYARGAYSLVGFSIPLLVVFSGLILFYRFAPRQPAHVSQVWIGSLCVMVLLLASESLFVIYLKDFATLNAVYGTLGGIMALLLWIFISGCIFIFGACLCAAQAEKHSASAKKSADSIVSAC